MEDENEKYKQAVENDPLGEALGLPPMNIDQSRITSVPSLLEPKTDVKTYVQDDYEFARQQMKDLIQVGAGIMSEAANIAQQNQQPESFQAAAQVMKNMIEATEKLLNLSATHQKVTGSQIVDDKKTEVTNNLFVGTTAELHQFLKKMKTDDSGN